MIQTIYSRCVHRVIEKKQLQKGEGGSRVQGLCLNDRPPPFIFTCAKLKIQGVDKWVEFHLFLGVAESQNRRKQNGQLATGADVLSIPMYLNLLMSLILMCRNIFRQWSTRT